MVKLWQHGEYYKNGQNLKKSERKYKNREYWKYFKSVNFWRLRKGEIGLNGEIGSKWWNMDGMVKSGHIGKKMAENGERREAKIYLNMEY